MKICDNKACEYNEHDLHESLKNKDQVTLVEDNGDVIVVSRYRFVRGTKVIYLCLACYSAVKLVSSL